MYKLYNKHINIIVKQTTITAIKNTIDPVFADELLNSFKLIELAEFELAEAEFESELAVAEAELAEPELAESEAEYELAEAGFSEAEAEFDTSDL